MTKPVLLLAFAVAAALASQAQANIAIINAYTDAQVYDGTNSADSSSFNQSGDTAVATLPVTYSSTTNTVYSVTGDAANFTVQFGHTRQGDLNTYAYSQIGFDFTVNTLSTYTASGGYSNPSGHTVFDSFLFDTNTSSYAFDNFQESEAAAANFTLGGMDGNSANTWNGSLTGFLLPGHTYSWFAIAFSQAYPDADLGASAAGELSLVVQSVPEHSSVYAWVPILLIVGGYCWWKRHAAVQLAS